MELNTSYKYEVEAQIVLDGKAEILPIASIKNIITNYNYEKNNMPIIYMSVSLTSSLYTRMIKNKGNGTINLVIYKIDTNSTNSVHREYIKDSFIYLINDKMYSDSEDSILYTGSREDTEVNDTSYKAGTLGLLKLDSINDNKKIINDIVKNSNIFSLICEYTSHMNMVIEPFKYNDEFETFIIPPITSITKFIKYVNSCNSFYGGPYRYFRDFNRTYLLSDKPNPIDCKDGQFNTVIIRIRQDEDNDSKNIGMKIDKDQKAYILDISENYVEIDVNTIADLSFNSLISVDTNGNSLETDFDLPSRDNNVKKSNISRVYNDNLKGHESTPIYTVRINITKTEIDSSLLTPNKEFIVDTKDSAYSKYNGKYILAYKKEVMVQQQDEFISTTAFGICM